MESEVCRVEDREDGPYSVYAGPVGRGFAEEEGDEGGHRGEGEGRVEGVGVGVPGLDAAGGQYTGRQCRWLYVSSQS